ncbi:MAG: PilZ domain-containing protein [Phycisphaerae bacterium]
MAIRTAERRRAARITAAHPVTIRDRRGRLLLRGRTSAISESGLYCLTDARRGLRLRGKVILEVTLPAGRSPRLRHSPTRTVRYAARIVRTEEIGQAVGMAIELSARLS